MIFLTEVQLIYSAVTFRCVSRLLDVHVYSQKYYSCLVSEHTHHLITHLFFKF